MSKDKPRNLAASVRNRLLDRARRAGEDFQLLLTHYVIERMLYRLSQSAWRNEFVLKGAMLFRVWTDKSHRPTRDVDLLGKGENFAVRPEPTPRKHALVIPAYAGIQERNRGPRATSLYRVIVAYH